MNRLKSRKKSFGTASRDGSRQGSRRPSTDEDVPAVPSFASKFMRRKAQPQPEPKPQVDLAVALPASDNFRTSLILPNLSARFSLLKEQDDPTSLIGKANDDSVLFPKRASRLDLFNTRPGLSDIAEVESQRGSYRPPFAMTRTESYNSDGYQTDDGSIMSRAKPGEGNTMFGGRQKIYKIPVGGAGSVKNFGGSDDHDQTTGGAMSGKPVYESDTTLSTFQRLRQAEREDRERINQDESIARPSREQDRSGSPPYNRYNRNRETSSSTTSAPSQSRASTAATSIASQKSVYAAQDNINGLPASLTQAPQSHPERAFIKTRRLYGQAVDRDPGNYQQPLQRVGSFNRFRGPTSGLASNPLRQSRSASNLGGRFQGDGAINHATNNHRAASPALSSTPPKTSDFDLGLHSDSSLRDVMDSGLARSPPLSPPKSPELNSHNPDPTLIASLEPNDLGKATASGAFNKPKKQYDEQQYLQRQLQMQSERDTPSPQFSRPFSPALSILNDQASAGRSRNNSQGSVVSRNNSVRRQWLEDRVPRPAPDAARHPAYRGTPENAVRPPLERSFFTSNSVSSSGQSPRFFGDFESPSPDIGSRDPDRLSGENESNLNGLDFDLPHHEPSTVSESPEDTPLDSRSYHSGTTITQQKNQPFDSESAAIANPESPALGPVKQADGLSSLVKAHLRSDSGQSSIYPEDLQRRSRRLEGRDSILGHSSALQEQMVHDPMPSNFQQEVDSRQNLGFAAHNILEQAKSLKAAESDKAKGTLSGDKAQQILGREAPRSHGDGTPAHHEQNRSYHNRGISAETQQERQDLAQELADRRKIVQDRLQSFVEAESRSHSPAPSSRSRSGSTARGINPMNLLKKSSQSSLGGKENNSKAMKMLGIENEAGGNPMPDNLVMRDQMSNHAFPPPSNSSNMHSQAREVPVEMSEALGLDRRDRSHGSQDRHITKRSPQSSKSDSAYSGNLDMTASNHVASNLNSNFGTQQENLTNGNAKTGRTRELNRPVPAWSNTGSDQTGPNASLRSYSDNRSPPVSHYGSGRRAAPAGTPYMINPANRTKTPNFPKSTPVSRDHPPPHSANQHATVTVRNSPTKPMFRSGQYRKQSVNKQDISEPTFISSTSSIDTIDLPPGASLRNGAESSSSPTSPPPVPARDARRKRTATFRQAFGRPEKGTDTPSTAIAEERSTFSDDEPSQKPKQRLKKINRDDATSIARNRKPSTGSSNPTSPIDTHFGRHPPTNAVMF